MLGSNFRDHQRRSRLFKKGDLKYVILDLLKDKPSHGYEIILTLEERFHGLYSPNAGSIYPVLQLLEDMGYVTPNVTEGKKVYTITDSGKGFLKEQKETTDKIKGRLRGWWGTKNRQYIQDVKVAMNYCRDIRRTVGYVAVSKEREKLARVKETLARTFAELEAINDE